MLIKSLLVKLIVSTLTWALCLMLYTKGERKLIKALLRSLI